MPCNNDGVPGDVAARWHLTDSCLCGIMRVLAARPDGPEILASVDWHKTGYSEQDLLRWWAEHKVRDDGYTL